MSSPAIDRIRRVAWEKGDNFDGSLLDYLRNYIVISNPEAFLMLLPVRVDGEEAWFVKMAAGPLPMLAGMFPSWKPKIIFDRAKAGRTKLYDSRRIYRLARKLNLALNQSSSSSSSESSVSLGDDGREQIKRKR